MTDDPAAALRARLERARADGLEFEPAWVEATTAIVAELPARFERDAWREALRDTAAAWEAAYNHAGARMLLSAELVEAA